MWAWLKKIDSGQFAKSLTGIATILIGAGTTFIPVVGPIAAPWIMGAGVTILTGGIIGKAVRYNTGGDVMEHEKALIANAKTKVQTLTNTNRGGTSNGV